MYIAHKFDFLLQSLSGATTDITWNKLDGIIALSNNKEEPELLFGK